MDDPGFAGLVDRAKSGDEDAVAELMARYEVEVRIMVRVRLPRLLRSQFDSMDFVQSVLKSFFVGMRDEPAGFDDERHLRGFLAGMVRNKVFEEHRRRTRTGKYDLGREEPLYVRRGGRDLPREVVAPGPSPVQEAQARDRLDQMVAGRAPREAAVVDLRSQGLTFEQIAARTGLNERTARRVIDGLRDEMEARRWQ